MIYLLLFLSSSKIGLFRYRRRFSSLPFLFDLLDKYD